MAAASEYVTVTDEALMAAVVARYAAQGYRVVARTETEVRMVRANELPFARGKSGLGFVAGLVRYVAACAFRGDATVFIMLRPFTDAPSGPG